MNPWWQKISTEFRLFAYDRQDKYGLPLELTNFIASVASLVLLIVLHGLLLSQEEITIIHYCLYGTFVIKLFHLFVRPSIEIEKRLFIRSHIGQYFIIGFFIINFLTDITLGFNTIEALLSWVGYKNFSPGIFAVQFYLLIFAISDGYGFLTKHLNLKLKPASMFLLSFIILIFIGTLLFTLPGMTTNGKGLYFIDALFTSVSATCVTGLIVVDTATAFSFKGQFVLMLLMQFGGIGIITFASFFTFFLLRSAGISQKLFMQDIIATSDFAETKSLLRQIIFYTLIIEIIGAILIYGSWSVDPDLAINQNEAKKIFFTIFHSISAFNNAGFSLFSEGLMEESVTRSPLVQIALMGLIIFGAFGFPAIRNLFDRNSLRDRLQNPWRQWELGTVVAVYSTIILVTIGALGFYLLERNNLLLGKDAQDTIITSLFQSVTTRTAGFNTVDIGLLSIPTVLMFLVLMIIGGNSGGTAGGLKTSTFVVITLAARSIIRNKQDIEIGNRSINVLLVERAFTIFLFAFSFLFVGVFILSITDPDKAIIDLVFEEVSAYATVGLSRGITADMSVGGKLVLLISMFLGRVGAITIAFALATPSTSNSVKYPEANMMVG